MTLLERTKSRLSELGLQPKKSLGQNFLVSDRVVEKIVQVLIDRGPRQVIEIGPGLGALTDQLRRSEAPIRLIELDRNLADYWRRQGFDVIEDDALKINWEKLSLPEGTSLVSNLPYQISTHLVVEMCLRRTAIDHMVLMFQKEVGERLMAKPRGAAYGLLSPMAQSFWQMRKVLEVSPREFLPPPKVASLVLEFERAHSPFAGFERDFLLFLKAAFAYRRKFMLKNLQVLRGSGFGARVAEVVPWLEETGLGLKVRAEELSTEQFQSLFRRIRGIS